MRKPKILQYISNETKDANRLYSSKDSGDSYVTVTNENGTFRKFEFELKNVLNGVHTLIFVPIDADRETAALLAASPTK